MKRLKKDEIQKIFGEPGEITLHPPGTQLVITRGRAPNPEEIVRAYLASIGRKGGLIGGKASTPAKRRAVRENGKLGGRPRKDQNNA